MPNGCNVPSRTIFTGDNLDILRGINSDCVDLIYLDPPFNSNQTYAAPLDSAARGAEFSDVWTLDDMKEEWVDEIELRMPALYHHINGARVSHSESMAGYLTFMSIRLIEMQRVLKRNGSIYLHCDDTAVHYLKPVMDALFGAQNYLNNIVWRRSTARNDPKRYGRILDHLLYYSKGGSPTWNGDAVREPRDEENLRRSYSSNDKRGRYRIDNMTGPKHSAERGSPSTLPWNGYDVYAMGRVWAVPKNGAYAEYIEREIVPGYRQIDGIHDRLDALDKADLIHHPTRGRWPGLKRYAGADKGMPPQNLITNPIGFTNYSTRSGEYTGYPTQKPLALLERIIAASSNEGDLVLDPFCGCATACIAAEKLGRNWIGIDIAPQAADILRDRARRELQIPIDDGNGNGADWQDWTPFILTAPTPRTDLELFHPADLQTIKETIYACQQGRCNGCKYELPLHVLTIDHIVPRSKGGLDTASNLQLLCHTCNAIKGNRDMPYLRTRLRQLGILID